MDNGINGRNIFDQAYAVNAAPGFENDLRSEHPGGANVLFADGHVIFLADPHGSVSVGGGLQPRWRGGIYHGLRGPCLAPIAPSWRLDEGCAGSKHQRHANALPIASCTGSLAFQFPFQFPFQFLKPHFYKIHLLMRLQMRYADEYKSKWMIAILLILIGGPLSHGDYCGF